MHVYNPTYVNMHVTAYNDLVDHLRIGMAYNLHPHIFSFATSCFEFLPISSFNKNI